MLLINKRKKKSVSEYVNSAVDQTFSFAPQKS